VTVPSAPDQHSAIERAWRRRTLDVVVAQLRQGVTADKIALTLAIGLIFGLFPIFGTTSALCVMAALWLKLNQPMIQLVNWFAAPLQLPGIYLFVRIGERLTHSAPVQFSIPGLVQQFRASPLQFLRLFGMTGLRGGPGLAADRAGDRRRGLCCAAGAAAPYGAAAAGANGTEFLQLWLAALLFAVVLMLLIWRLAVRIGNAGIVDIAWAAGFAPVVIWYAAAASGAPARRALIALDGEHLEPAPRRLPLCARQLASSARGSPLCAPACRLGCAGQRKMFGFFQLQAALLALLSRHGC
jgi:hypothetical protein